MEDDVGSKKTLEHLDGLEVSGKEPESIASSILAKGRITVWLILVGCFVSAAFGVLTGDQLIDVIKVIGGLWLGGELGARKP